MSKELNREKYKCDKRPRLNKEEDKKVCFKKLKRKMAFRLLERFVKERWDTKIYLDAVKKTKRV